MDQWQQLYSKMIDNLKKGETLTKEEKDILSNKIQEYFILKGVKKMKLNGEYVVYFKPPDVEKRDYYRIRKFIGECINFVENGTCAFRNNNEILLVQTNDILQLRLKK